MRTKSEAKILEADVVIFPMNFGQNLQETILTEDVEKIATMETNPNEDINENRFSRLRKSLRKRSASIL